MIDNQLKLKNQLCFRLYTAARLTMGAYHPYLNPLGITYPQYLVMLVLWEQDRQPVCDIAKKLLLDTNTVTPLLQRMEKSGLIVRTKGKEDTRQRIVSLTKKGKELYKQANFYVIKNTNCPAVLTENLFQDNHEDVEFLMSPEGKAKIVELHYQCIKQYCGV